MNDTIGINFNHHKIHNNLFDKEAILKVAIPIDIYEEPPCSLWINGRQISDATILRGSKLVIDAKSPNRYGYIERVAEQIGKFAAYRMIRSGKRYARVKCKQDIFSHGNLSTRNAVLHSLRDGFVSKRYPNAHYRYVDVNVYYHESEYFVTDTTDSTIEERRAIHRLLWNLKQNLPESNR